MAHISMPEIIIAESSSSHRSSSPPEMGMTLEDARENWAEFAQEEGVPICPHKGTCSPACDNFSLGALQMLRYDAGRRLEKSLIDRKNDHVQCSHWGSCDPACNQLVSEYIRHYGLQEATLRAGTWSVLRVCKLDQVVPETPPRSSSLPTVTVNGREVEVIDLTNDTPPGKRLTDHDLALIDDYQESMEIEPQCAQGSPPCLVGQLPSSDTDESNDSEMNKYNHRKIKNHIGDFGMKSAALCYGLKAVKQVRPLYQYDNLESFLKNDEAVRQFKLVADGNKENCPPILEANGHFWYTDRDGRVTDLGPKTGLGVLADAAASRPYVSPTPSLMKDFRHQTPFKSQIISEDPTLMELEYQGKDWVTGNLDGLPDFFSSRSPRVVTTGHLNNLSTLSKLLGESTTYRESCMRMADIISIVSSTSNGNLNSRAPTVSVLGPLRLIRADAALSILIATYSLFREHPSMRGTTLASTETSSLRTVRDRVLEDLTSRETTCGRAAWLNQTKKHFFKTLKSILRETSSSSIGKSALTATRHSGGISKIQISPKSKRTASTYIGRDTRRSGNGSWRASKSPSPESSPCPEGCPTLTRRNNRTSYSSQLISEDEDLNRLSSGVTLD